MKKIITWVLYFLFHIPFCNLYAQPKHCLGEKYVHQNYLQVNNKIVYSFCDSLIKHSKTCLSSPAWYKLKFNESDKDSATMNIWCVLVQFIDSSYFNNNKGWLIESDFSPSPTSVGMFSYNGLRFEVIAPPSFPIDLFFTKTDSLVQVYMWDSSAKPVMMPIRATKFPHYFHMSGTINLTKNEISVSQELCTCNDFTTRKQKNKRNN
ncbi:MAG: hypothetical protein J6S56_05410 [Bacteroidales bacterium]|nr:hypothetical protein [Bacteroidales bacterium]